MNIRLLLTGECEVDNPKLNTVIKGPWTDLIPKLLKAEEETKVEYNWVFVIPPNIHQSVASVSIRYFWLSICRDEDLIQRAIKVVEELNKVKLIELPIGLVGAIRLLQTALLMRGRTV